MSDEAEREAIALRILLGQDGISFKGSVFGKYLLDRAEEEARVALDELLELSITDPSAVAKISAAGQKVKRFDDFEGWIDEAISIGQNSEIESDMLDGRRPID